MSEDSSSENIPLDSGSEETSTDLGTEEVTEGTDPKLESGDSSPKELTHGSGPDSESEESSSKEVILDTGPEVESVDSGPEEVTLESALEADFEDSSSEEVTHASGPEAESEDSGPEGVMLDTGPEAESEDSRPEEDTDTGSEEASEDDHPDDVNPASYDADGVGGGNLITSHWSYKTKLYPGSNISVLKAVCCHLNTFMEHSGMSKANLESVLASEHSVLLPPENKMPSSFRELMSIIKPLLIPLSSYHVCPKGDYIYFKDSDHSLAECPVCGTKRDNEEMRAKTFHYLPIIPRLIRLYSCPKMAKLLQSHNLLHDPPVLTDIQDTEEWQKWFSPGNIFDGDRRGVALGFATDGVNPCKTIGKECSIWPLYMKIFNFPPSLRNEMGHLMLCGVIEGDGKKEPPTLDPYMEVILQELQSCEGRLAYDALKKEFFALHVAVVRFITDFMGRCKLFHCVGPMGLRACPWCKLQGFRCMCLGKTVFPGNRRYLREGHPLRFQDEWFPHPDCNPSGGLIPLMAELRDHPGNSSHEERVHEREVYQRTPTKLGKARLAKAGGVYGQYPMLTLPYHNEVKHTHPDGMHVIKQSFSHLLDFLSGNKKVDALKTSDSVHRLSPPVRYALTGRELEEANRRASAIIAPLGSSFNAGPVFTDNLPNTSAVHEVC